MPLASRVSSPTQAEPKSKKPKTVKKRTSARASAAAAAKEAANTTTSSTENDEHMNNIVDSKTPSPTKMDSKNAEAAEPLQVATNKMSRSKSASNGIASSGSSSKLSNDIELKPDLNDTMNDTIMTDVTINNPSDAITPECLVNLKTAAKPGFCLSVGENLSNQLGLTLDVDGRKKPQLIKLLPKQGEIVMGVSGGMHSAVLTKDGVVYTFGCNDEFALGRADDEDIEAVDLPEKMIEITAGDSHTAALSESGVVYAWGTFRDGSGVVGLETQKIAKTPMKFNLREKIVKISSGADHLVFLTVTGDVYTAGNSEHGQLGRISKYNSFRGGRRGSDMILVPGLVRIGKKKELGGNRKVEDIWTSSYCTYLKIKDSESIVAFGLNNCYQLGAEDMENRYQPDLIQTLKFMAPLKKVIGGMHHTLFLDTNGRVYSMGSHRYGCLGLGKIEADVGFPTIIPDLINVVDIAANTNTSYAINKEGKCFSWGTNYSKQLGQDDEEDYYVPTLVKSKQLDSRQVYSVSIGGQHSLLTIMSADASSSQKPIAPLEVLSTDGSQKQSPQIISTGKEEDICDDWEQLDQNQIKKSLKSIKLSQATENEEQTIKNLPKSNLGSFPQPQTSNPANNNTIKILRRPPSEKSLKDMNSANSNPAQPIKTFEQREQEYAQARLRILGSAHPEQDLPVPTLNNYPGNSNQLSSNINFSAPRTNQPQQGNTNIIRPNFSPNNTIINNLSNNSLIREPLAPDSLGGFNKRNFNYNQANNNQSNNGNANNFRNNKS